MKITKTVFLHWSSCVFNTEGRFSVWDMDMSRADEFSPVLATQEIEFEIEDFDTRTATVDLLRAKKDSIIQKATQKAKEIDEKIEELLALELQQ